MVFLYIEALSSGESVSVVRDNNKLFRSEKAKSRPSARGGGRGMKKPGQFPGRATSFGEECGDLFGEFPPERFVCRIAQAQPGRALAVVTAPGVIV